MKILLTNDDGIHAKGINTFYEVLSREHDVYMVAPHLEKSACSSAISIRGELIVQKLDDFRYAVEGFPADCVNMGLHSGFIPEVDLIVSGINHGPNLGSDIYYSGTVGAARTGYIYGKSALAVSLNCLVENDFFQDISEHVAKLIREKNLFITKEPVLYNINYPALEMKDIKGIQYTYQGSRSYTNDYKVVKEDNNRFHLEMKGEFLQKFTEGSDEKAIEEKYISITPMDLDTTNYELLKQLQNSVKTG